MNRLRKNIMNAKSSNIKYICFVLFTVITVLMLVIASAAKRSDNLSNDYNTVLYVDNYIIKISNAAYITDKGTFAFMFSHKLNNEESFSSEGSELFVQTVTVYYDNGKIEEKTAEEIQTENRNEISAVVTVSAEDNIKYAEIILCSKGKDYYDEDSVDEFGQIIKGAHHKGEEKWEKISVGRSDIEYITEDKFNKEAQKAVNAALKADNDEPEQTTAVTSVTSVTEPKTEQTSRQTSVSSKTAEVTEKTTIKTSKTHKTASRTTEKTSQTEPPVTQPPKSETPQTQVPQTAEPKKEEPTKAQTEKPKKTEKTESKAPVTKKPKEKTTSKAKPKETKSKPKTTKAEIKVNTISLSTGFADNNVKLAAGTSRTVKAVIKPDNATNKKVVWSSNRPEIAAVDSSGKITAKAEGVAIITAESKDGGLSASCMVTVKER